VAAFEVKAWPLFGTVGETWYAKPQSGKLLLSPADEDPVDPHDAWPEDAVTAPFTLLGGPAHLHI